MNTLQHYLEAIRQPFSLEGEDSLSFGPAKSEPTIMVFSPHPDDECVVGALPLRWRHQKAARVINVAVTLGSNRERQQARLKELERACEHLHFENHVLGWEEVLPREVSFQAIEDRRRQRSEHLAGLIREYRPLMVCYPHLYDLHPAHIGVHELVEDALRTIPPAEQPWRCYTEFWHPMVQPNLMVEVDRPLLAQLLRALAEHVGEIERNPYHLKLPAWMIDNTRRGSERICGKGTETYEMPFTTLYRLEHATGKEVSEPTLPASSSPDGCL